MSEFGVLFFLLGFKIRKSHFRKLVFHRILSFFVDFHQTAVGLMLTIDRSLEAIVQEDGPLDRFEDFQEFDFIGGTGKPDAAAVAADGADQAGPGKIGQDLGQELAGDFLRLGDGLRGRKEILRFGQLPEGTYGIFGAIIDHANSSMSVWCRLVMPEKICWDLHHMAEEAPATCLKYHHSTIINYHRP